LAILQSIKHARANQKKNPAQNGIMRIVRAWLDAGILADASRVKRPSAAHYSAGFFTRSRIASEISRAVAPELKPL
jgi:hypothetical protein